MTFTMVRDSRVMIPTKGHRYTLPLLGVVNPLFLPYYLRIPQAIPSLVDPMTRDNLDTNIIAHDRNLIIMISS